MRSFARWSWIAAYAACAPVDDTATTGPTEHCGAITSDEAWSASGNPHVLTCTVSVDGAVLTIEAGVQVEVQRGDYELRVAESGAGGLVVAGSAEAPVRLVPANEDDAWHSLSFFPGASPATLVRVELLEDTDIKVGVGDGCSASLTAVGRADAPVVFASGDEAPVVGAWGGILIADGAVGTFDYVEIGHGGKDYFYFYPMQGALDFYGASGSVDHTFVHDAACYALDLKDADVIVGELTGADNGCADVNDQG